MSSLSDQLKRLGVKVGAGEIKAPLPSKRDEFTIEKVLPGRLVETPNGAVYIVEQVYPWGSPHGAARIGLDASVENLSRWAGINQIKDLPVESYAFLDTETSGLAGGTGTYAFLIGAGRFEHTEAEGLHFHLAQFFMRDPTEEPALLLALEQFLAPCQALVTFNGKAFDAPLLNTRYTMAGWRSPLPDLAHVDLLHLARKLWRDSLPSRTLGTLEVQILRTSRTEEEVPGWMIPQMYFDYLRSGDAREMKKVFYHNAMDVVSLAALLNHTAGMLASPLEAAKNNPTERSSQEVAALARLFEDLGDEILAEDLYHNSLDEGLTGELFWETTGRLALLHKRRGEYDQAIVLWKKAATREPLETGGSMLIAISAQVELAKAYEHVLREPAQAIYWTESALALVNQPTFPRWDRQNWLAELEHRLERLKRKSPSPESP